MSRERGQELKDNIVRGKADEYQKLREQYVNDEISEQEFEARTKQLLDNGEEFLEYEETTADVARDAGRSLKQKLRYYALPLMAIAPFALSLIVPSVSPMAVIMVAPAILFIVALIWILLKAEGYVN